jgi:hypothetical protein
MNTGGSLKMRRLHYERFFVLAFIFIILLLTFSSCCYKVNTQEYFLKEVKKSDVKNGNDSTALFIVKNSRGEDINLQLFLRYLHVKVKENPNGYTELQIIESKCSDEVGIKINYCLYVNSNEELTAWEEWIKEKTTPEPQIIFPPDYKAKEITPEKEEGK